LAKDHSNLRLQIMSAAYRLLADKGYDAATMKEIAQEAGVAPGLIHYYFQSKDQLLLEVLKAAADRYVRQMEQLGETLEGHNLMLAAFAEPKQQLEQEPEWYRLRCELFALGLRNPKFLPAAAAILVEGRRCIGELMCKIAGQSVAEPNATAAVLLAALDGLALQHLLDPNFDYEAAYDEMFHLFQLRLNMY
jgi:AcrR family transcriptional regulator